MDTLNTSAKKPSYFMCIQSTKHLTHTNTHNNIRTCTNANTKPISSSRIAILMTILLQKILEYIRILQRCVCVTKFVIVGVMVQK